MTSGPYKLIHTPATRRSELFDRSTDSAEALDLAADPAHRDTLVELQRILRAWDHLTRGVSQGLRVEGNRDALDLLRSLGYVGDEDETDD